MTSPKLTGLIAAYVRAFIRYHQTNHQYHNAMSGWNNMWATADIIAALDKVRSVQYKCMLGAAKSIDDYAGTDMLRETKASTEWGFES